MVNHRDNYINGHVPHGTFDVGSSINISYTTHLLAEKIISYYLLAII